MDQFALIFDDLIQLLKRIEQYKVVHVFIDESVNLNMQNKICGLLAKKVKVLKTVISPCFATQKLADSLVFNGEDFALAIGKLHLQSLVKYYCYANNIKYGLIPISEVAEYSFCKYAFLKDDKFCFYVCEKPSFALILQKFFSQDDIFRLEKILSYKNIVLYEKEFEKLVLKQEIYDLSKIVKSINICDGSYKSVIKLYGAISLLLDNTTTSLFLGAEYTVLSLLALNKKDISQNLICATTLLARFYECMNKFDTIRVMPNINKQIMLLKKEFNISFSNVRGYMQNYSQQELKTIEYTLKAYNPYLKVMFNNCKTSFMYSNVDFSSAELEKALALSGCICQQKNILHFAKDFGYFENLLK